MAGTNVSQVYISVIEDVVANVREDFITYGVGDAVLNELQAVSFFPISRPPRAANLSNFRLISAI
jgi:transcription initiation factor TFIIA large subunit